MSNKLVLLVCSLGYLLFSCSSHDVQGPVGHVFLAYTGGKQPIASLPFRIRAMEFIASDGSLHRARLGDKTLDMAVQGSHSIKGIKVPAESFHRIRWHLSFQDSQLQMFNAFDKRWMSVQMVDSDQQYVPQTRSEFFYETDLPDPIVIQAHENHFLEINIQPLRSLSLANTESESRYVLIDPQLSIKAVDSLPIAGELISINDNELKMEASGIPLTVTIEQLLKQGVSIEKPFEINNSDNLHVQMIAQKNAGNPSIIQADVNLIEGNYYEGFVSSSNDNQANLVLKGHEFNLKSGVLFHAEHALPEGINGLQKGQRLALYETKGTPITEDNLRLLPGNVDAMVSTTTPAALEIISINGFAPEAFYSDKLDIATKLPESIAVNDLLRLSGFFVSHYGSHSSGNFVAESASYISADKVSLQMNFHLFNDAMLLHETDDAGNTRLFFLKSMDNVLSDITLQDTQVIILSEIKEIYLNKTTTMALIIQRGDMNTKTSYKDFNAFSSDLQSYLNTHKLFRLQGVGELVDEQIHLDDFTLTLQANTLIADNNLLIEDDSMVDMTFVNDASGQHIERDKDSLGLSKKTDQSTNINDIQEEQVTDESREISKPTIIFSVVGGISVAAAIAFVIKKRQEARAETEGDKELGRQAAARLLSTVNQENDYKAFEKISGQINSRRKTTDPQTEKINKHVFQNLQSIAREEEKLGVSQSYHKSSYLREIDLKGNKRSILNANYTDFETATFLEKNPELMKKMNFALDNLPGIDTVIQFHNGRVFVNANNFEILPLTYIQANKTFDKAAPAKDQKNLKPVTYKGIQYEIKKETVSNTQLYKVQLRDGNQKPGENGQQQLDTVVLVTGDDDQKVDEAIRHFIDVTPIQHRQALYYGVENGNILQALLDNHKTSQNKAIVGHVRFANFKGYRLDQAKLHTVGNGQNKTQYHYMDDDDIKRTAAVNNVIDSTMEQSLNRLNPGRLQNSPEELRVLIHLENDEKSINTGLYKQYQRYPEHTVVLQMNNNGDFTIVNGIDNIPKFTAPKYKDKIIFQPYGHGSRFTQGAQSPESLARNLSQFVDNAPEVMERIYNAKYPNSAINKNQISITPSHFNMAGCSLGKRGPWFIDTLTENFSDKFVTFNHDNGKVNVPATAEITKKQLIFYGASFAEKFSYSFNAEGKKLPKVVEAWDVKTAIDDIGQTLTGYHSLNELLLETKKHHRIFTLGNDGFAQQVKDVKYQLNPAGFVEYQLPQDLDSSQKFHKVFRGPLLEEFSSE